MSSLIAKIEGDLKEALKNREERKISILRLLLSDIHNQEIAKRGKLTEEEVQKVLSQAVKKHKDSIDQFQKGHRNDLVEKEQEELEIIKSYLPEVLSAEALQSIIREVIGRLKPQGSQDFGKVMKFVMAEVKNRASGEEVAKIVKEELNPSSPNSYGG